MRRLLPLNNFFQRLALLAHYSQFSLLYDTHLSSLLAGSTELVPVINGMLWTDCRASRRTLCWTHPPVPSQSVNCTDMY